MPAFTFGGFDYREAGADYLSPTAALGWSASEIQTEYLVKGDEWLEACQALLGSVGPQTATLNGDIVTYLSRNNPHVWPMGNAGFYATSIVRAWGEGTPIGKDADGVMRYSDVRIKVSYQEPMWDIADDNAVRNPAYGNIPDESQLLRNIWRIEIDREKQLTYREGSWQWISNDARLGKPVSNVTGRSWPITRIVFRWMQVPYVVVPRLAHRFAVGGVNADTWDGCPAGTLLFRATQYEVYRNFLGVKMANCAITADCNPLGWNYFPDPLRRNGFFPVGQYDPAVGVLPNAQPYLSVSYLLAKATGRPTALGGGNWSVADLFRPSATG